MLSRSHRRLAISLAASLAVGLLLSAAFGFNFLSGLQAQSTDILFKVRPASSLEQFAKRITMVAMDDKSLVGLGYWLSWERSDYASVVRTLAGAGARVVVLDVAFDQSRPGDEELARAISEAGMVVQPVSGSPNLPEASRPGEAVRFKGFLGPQPMLAAASAALGHANVLTDEDGAVRRVPLLIRAGDQQFPSVALAATALYLRRASALDAPATFPYLRAAGRAIPVDPFYRMIINYAGRPSTSGGSATFSVVSFIDVLEGRADPALFRDRIVFVGLMGASGFADDFWVPTASAETGKMAGVEIHASAAATILSNAFVNVQESSTTIGLVLLLAVASAALASVLPPVLAAAGSLGLSLAYLLFAFALFDRGVVMNLVYPQLSIYISFVTATAYRVVFEEAEQRATLKAMSQYLSPAVMREVMKDPGKLGLGGEKREMTVLFSDIRGFTSLSERLDPQHLVHLLNEYLTAMTEVVFSHGGVLDKYMGDALMAFWGAPVAQSDHASRACSAALGMVRGLKDLQKRWQEQGIPELNMGIGVSTGLMSVGNMGSTRRFDYTVMGDAVNLGSRLEGLNKEFGTNVVISARTWDRVKEAGFVARPLDIVVVKGRTEPVAIFELMGISSDFDPQRETRLGLYVRGMDLYRRREWNAAEKAFSAVLEVEPGDGPASVYVSRCRALAGSPQDEAWDGVFVMERK